MSLTETFYRLLAASVAAAGTHLTADGQILRDCSRLFYRLATLAGYIGNCIYSSSRKLLTLAAACKH